MSRGTSSQNFASWHKGLLLSVGLVLAGGLGAACGSSASSTPTTKQSGSTTSTPTTHAGGSTAGLNALVTKVSKNSTSTFSATYQTSEASTGTTQTVTFAQSPPKSAIVTPTGSFLINGSSVTVCEGPSTAATCTALPSSMTSEVSGLSNLFSPSVILNDLKSVKSQAEASAAGYKISTSSATYGGLASSCVTVTSTSESKQVTYCAADSNGVLTYVNAGGSTVTLQAFTANPPSSTFEPPAGATVETVPSET